jgi:dihydropyrimidinase
MSHLLLANCLAVHPHRVTPCSILTEEGKIVALLPPNDRPMADTTIDVRGRPVIPGGIDTHVHLGGRQVFARNCATESRAAVAGGITTLMQFLMQRDSYVPVIPDYERDVIENSLVDIWFHAAIMSEEQLEEIDKYIRDFRITSFKFFMAYKGREARPMLSGVDDGLLLESLRLLSQYPECVAMVHCENMELIERNLRMVEQTGRQDAAAWTEARPAIGEEEAQLRAWFFARTAQARLLVVHMSVGYTADQLRVERRRYPHLYGETCPHYLVLDNSLPIGPRAKVNPPLRDRANAELLWQGLANGALDVVGSDHCVFSRELKGNDLWTAPPGLPGMPLILPVLLSEGVNKGRLTLEQVVQANSYNAARIFGLYPRKGAIDVGADADLVVLDMDREKTVGAEMLGSAVDWTPYEGLRLKGWPLMTIVRGHLVAEDGKVVNDSGHGERITHTPFNQPVAESVSG